MKSWFDLPKNEQKELKKEFKTKKKLIDLRIPFYVLAILCFIPLLIVFASKVTDTCYGNSCESNAALFGILFGIFFILAIISSINVSNHEKAFKSWLKTKNIEK